MPPTTDEVLMRAYTGGDREALGVLFDRHAESLRAFLLRATGSAALAADLTQSSFLSVVRGRARYREQSTFKTWLYAIALNALADYYRRAKREVAHDAAIEHLATADAPADPVLARNVRRALARLPRAYQEIIVLQRCAGYSLAEIAAHQGTSEAAAKVRSHRAQARLRELLGSVWRDDE